MLALVIFLPLAIPLVIALDWFREEVGAQSGLPAAVFSTVVVLITTTIIGLISRLLQRWSRLRSKSEMGPDA